MARRLSLRQFRRGRGITVAGTVEDSAVIAEIQALLHFARGRGYRRGELISLIETLS